MKGLWIAVFLCAASIAGSAQETDEPTIRDHKERNGSRTPIPDPTVLTTVQLNREIAALRDVITTRLEGMDRAQELLREDLKRIPGSIGAEISQVKALTIEKFALTDERFKGIELQFKERDTRTEQASLDSRVRVDAAFAASKEAVAEQNKSNAMSIAKSETATNKQLDQLALLVEKSIDGVRIQIAELKERLSINQGKEVGSSTTEHSQQTSSSFTLALIVAGMSLIGLIVMMMRGGGQHPVIARQSGNGRVSD